MNQDFDQFGSLWRQEPADEEVRMFRKLARRAGRRGRMLQHAELGLGLFVIAGALAALFWKPAPATLAVAVLIVAGILWSSWKRSQYAQVAAMLDRSDREALLESAERSARARLKSSTLGLILLVPGWMLGVALKGMLLFEGDFLRFLNLLLASFTEKAGMASALIVLAIFMVLVRSHWKLRRELRRLERLRAQYRDEAALERES